MAFNFLTFNYAGTSYAERDGCFDCQHWRQLPPELPQKRLKNYANTPDTETETPKTPSVDKALGKIIDEKNLVN